MAKMLGKSGIVSSRPNCPCCNMSESSKTDKKGGKKIKRQREKVQWWKESFTDRSI